MNLNSNEFERDLQKALFENRKLDEIILDCRRRDI